MAPGLLQQLAEQLATPLLHPMSLCEHVSRLLKKMRHFGRLNGEGSDFCHCVGLCQTMTAFSDAFRGTSIAPVTLWNQPL